MDFIRPYVSRVIAAPIAALCAYLLLHWKVNIDTATQAQLASAVVAFVLPFFAAIYAVIHKIIDSRFNPTDAANKVVASSTTATVNAQRNSAAGIR